MTEYQIVNLAGSVLYSRDLITQESDLIELRHLIAPLTSVLVPAPLVLVVSSVVVEIAARLAIPNRDREMNPHLETLPSGWNIQARTGRGWTRILPIDSHGKTEREYLEHAALTCGMEMREGESTAQLVRRFLLHLAAQTLVGINEA